MAALDSTEDRATPITLECSIVMRQSPVEIAAAIADLSNWSRFEGWGPLPGIASATYDHRTDSMNGSRISVVNRDGSKHTEEIVEWTPGERVVLRLGEFSPPLRQMATHFLEVWTFEPGATGTLVRRRMTIHPTSALTRIPLILIGQLMRRALQRHLDQMSAPDPPASWRGSAIDS